MCALDGFGENSVASGKAVDNGQGGDSAGGFVQCVDQVVNDRAGQKWPRGVMDQDPVCAAIGCNRLQPQMHTFPTCRAAVNKDRLG